MSRRGALAPVAWAVAAVSATAGAPQRDEGVVRVVASQRGFRPGVLSLRKGEAVRLVLSTADAEHCFAVDAFRVEKRILPGRTVTLDLTPDRAGTFPFYCCLEPDNGALQGRVVVAE